MVKKMREAAGNFDFMELGQAIQNAREKQRITREELAEELGISARHLQSIEKEGQYPSFPLFIQLLLFVKLFACQMNDFLQIIFFSWDNYLTQNTSNYFLDMICYHIPVTCKKAGTPPLESLVPAYTLKRLMPPSKIMITLLLPDFNPMPEKVLEIYNSVVANLKLHQLTCPCGHSGCLCVHAYYHRTLKTPAGPVRMRIMRVFCRECEKTHALLPAFIVPYSQIPAPYQAKIAQQAEGSRDFSAVMEHCPCINESNIRSVIRNYLLHWKERLLSYAIPFMPFDALVSRCFYHHHCQFMQIKIRTHSLFPDTT